MIRLIGWIACTLVVACGVASRSVQAQHGQATPRPWPAEVQSLQMRSAIDTGQNGLGKRLYGGQVADAKDWPASLFGHYVLNGKSFVCSATLVGPRAVLTAAHCMDADGKIAFSRQGTDYVADCTRPVPGSPAVRSADWALCLVRKAPVTGTKFERLSLDPGLLRPGRSVMLTGYGCKAMNLDGTDDESSIDHAFRFGTTRVDLGVGQVFGDAYWVQTASGLRVTPSGPQFTGTFVCRGDSGGAVYATSPSGRRYIVAVVSNEDTDIPRRGISYLSALSVDPARQYISDWKTHNAVKVCDEQTQWDDCR